MRRLEESDAGPGPMWIKAEAAEVLDSLRCAVCLGYLNATVIAPCMHRFCQGCAELVPRSCRDRTEIEVGASAKAVGQAHCLLIRCVEKWIRIGRPDCPECKQPVRTRRCFRRDLRVDALVPRSPRSRAEAYPQILSAEIAPRSHRRFCRCRFSGY